MTTLTKDFNPAKLDLYIDQGDDFNKIVTLTDQDGESIDLTGFSFTTALKEYYNTSKNLPLMAEVFGNPLDGKIRLSMDSLSTGKLIKPRYVYSVRADNNTDFIRVLDGQVLVQPIA